MNDDVCSLKQRRLRVARKRQNRNTQISILIERTVLRYPGHGSLPTNGSQSTMDLDEAAVARLTTARRSLRRPGASQITSHTCHISYPALRRRLSVFPHSRAPQNHPKAMASSSSRRRRVSKRLRRVSDSPVRG
jgi:hypothetical protein